MVLKKKKIRFINCKIKEIGLELFLKTINRSSLSDVWLEFVANLWCISKKKLLPQTICGSFLGYWASLW